MNLEELRYRIYGDDRLSGKLDRISGAGRKTDRTLGSVSNKMGSLKKNIRGAAAEIPGLGSGLRFLGNPLTMAAGGIMLLATGLNKAKNEAAAFNTEYRELINLNLDKSQFQRQLLKSNVLQTSAREGFDPLQTSTAYYDVQSITGKFGYDVEKLVEKAGRFAKVMRADFNQTIAGSAQAMDIYGIKTSQVDDYLASLYKTVLVGKTTFNELTKVQVEYANAASSVGQDYNNANRIYAAFSKTQKTATIAATMTKTAFEDLTKKSTIKGMEQIGVKVFDAKKQMRGVDEILEDLIPKLKGMNDLQYAKFKENIGGSEGIKGLLDMARNSADKLLASFKQFDNAEFSMADAIREARKDVNYLNDEINGKLRVSWINMGQTILPVWVNIKNSIIGMVDEINDSMYEKMRSIYHFTDKEKYEEMAAVRNKIHFETGYGEAKGEYSKLFEGDLSKLSESELKKKIEDIKAEKYKVLHPLTMPIDKQRWADATNKLQGYRKFFNQTINALETGNLKAISELYGGAGSGGSGGGSIDEDLQKGLNGISGGGSKATTITITIGKLNENININTTQLSEATPEIEDKMTETLVRAIAGAEQIMAN